MRKNEYIYRSARWKERNFSIPFSSYICRCHCSTHSQSDRNTVLRLTYHTRFCDMCAACVRRCVSRRKMAITLMSKFIFHWWILRAVGTSISASNGIYAGTCKSFHDWRSNLANLSDAQTPIHRDNTTTNPRHFFLDELFFLWQTFPLSIFRSR